MVTQVVLSARTGELAGRRLFLQGPAQWRLGRSRACSLRLRGDDRVSRQHCVLELGMRALMVQDLGSLNGTFLNGENIGMRPGGDEAQTLLLPAPRPLTEGDELRVGHHAFRVEGIHTEGPPAEEVSEKDHGACALCG